MFRVNELTQRQCSDDVLSLQTIALLSFVHSLFSEFVFGELIVESVAACSVCLVKPLMLSLCLAIGFIS